ncbi:MFS transporter [Aurantimonas sp. MSK8Z-1]|uniref:MFS transporter n=1 Tax=Mangrovibrevibacter kandeliae TaxID=2968473 RepID=UPI002117F18F|nr:MFS transporter [Aurantimonas sp. MSK8Z-1]MCW4116333.1 MFS transporter [Aurantimonas sp. MSK8Z-1]
MNTNAAADRGDGYKWVALSNTTLGMLAAAINSSILLISLPAIFRGIHLDPLEPSNINFLLWTIMGYLVAVSVLVVTFGRLGDIFGRARVYNWGFLVFALASVALCFIPGEGQSAALYLIVIRILQAVGGASIMANSTAILTDAFPADQRGLALGINTIAAIGGQFIGLLIGGLLADWNWVLVFWINVPFGVIGTAWGFWRLRDSRTPPGGRLDLLGNVSFAVGLVLVLTAITYGIQPYGDQVMGWGSPLVLTLLGLGLVVLVGFVLIERRVTRPMFDLDLFRIRPFTMANLASLASSVARGGLQFMLIIWLQGIWLPLHGYTFESTPLWSAIYMIPLTVGFLLAGPVSGWLSDHYGARPFAAGGMIVGAASFVALLELPADFDYGLFAFLIFLNGLGSGLFIAPNTTAIMNSVPARERGQAAGMRATTMNAGMVLSIGIFFSLMIAGLAQTLPQAMEAQLLTQNVPADVAHAVASAPPVGSLFAAFLGYNPMGELIPQQVLASLPPGSAEVITGQEFFPQLMAVPFMHGLGFAFGFSALLYLLSAIASWLAGGKFVHQDHGPQTQASAEERLATQAAE